MAAVIVVGAGISGLASAYWLQKKGHDVTVLEKNDRAGGVIQTLREEGYLFEKGPNSFLDNGVETLDLCAELKLENELLKQSMRDNKRYIYLQGKLNEVPTGPGGLFKSPLITPQARKMIFTEIFRGGSRSPEDESLASFIRRRLGDDVLNNLVTPFVSGVYAGDPEKLSLRATFPLLFELEREAGSVFRGLIIRGFRKKDPNKKKKPRARNLCSFVDGMEAMIRRITDALGSKLRLSTEVTSVSKTENGYNVVTANGGTLFCDVLVLAAPAYAAAEMVRELMPTASAYMKTIPYNRLNVVGLGFGREQIQHECSGFGYLVPRNQGVRILGSIWSSSLFVRRAPDGERAFTVFIGGGLDPEAYRLSDEALRTTVLADLRTTVGVSGEPRAMRIFRWEKAIPQYPVGHMEQMNLMSGERLHVPGLFLTGNYLDGVSVNDCIRNAQQTSEDVHVYAASLVPTYKR